MDHPTRSRWALLLTALLLLAALAGCTTPEGDGDVADPGGDGEEPPAMTREQALASYRTAMTALGSDETEPPERFSMRMEATELGGTGSIGHMDVLVDTAGQIAIMEMGGAFADDSGEMMMMEPGTNESLVFGQVAKTDFFGTTTNLFAIYNESADPVTGMDAADPEQDPASDSPDPAQMISAFGDLPENATVTHESITHEGQAALRVQVTDDDGTDITAIIYLDPPRPAVVEGKAPQSPNSTDLMEMRMTFGYGDDASHSLEEALVRAESLAMLNSSQTGGAFMMDGSQEETRNWTIQPSTGSGTIPLSEVTLEVYNDTSGEEAPLLALPLEEGEVADENGTIRAAYIDTDGDGHISEGDRVELSGNGSSDLSVTLHDEVTGLRLAPGPGLLGLVAVGLASLFVARRD